MERGVLSLRLECGEAGTRQRVSGGGARITSGACL